MVLGLLWCNVVQALPKCKGEDYSKWTNCVGAYTNDKHKYTGEFGNDPGKRHGKGIVIKKKLEPILDVVTYKGQWKNDKPNGYGTFTVKSLGYKYTGKFKDGLRHGHGREFSYLKPNDPSGFDSYVGEFKNGTRNGKGTSEGKIEIEHKGKKYKTTLNYTGDWKNSIWHGQGKLIFNSKIQQINIEGEFKEGQVNGQATVYKNGKLFGKGIWENDRLIDSTKDLRLGLKLDTN